METTKAVVKPKKTPSSLLIGVLIVLLIGTGIGVYLFTKPKSKDFENEDEDETGEGKKQGANGRNVTNHEFPLTPEQIQLLLQTPSVGPSQGTPGDSPSNPIYYRDPLFLTAVDQAAYEMQSETSNKDKMDVIRALYNIGEGMMGRDTEEQECIEYLFDKLPNVDFSKTPNRKYLAFPVYGTNEMNGAAYRAELQKIIDSGWRSHNLTHLRADGNPWFCKEIGLNLLVGTTWVNTPKTNHVLMSWAPRSEVDFYKKFNRCWVEDRHLAEKYVNKRDSNSIVLDHTHPDARAAYCASGMFDFVERWIREIDRLDHVTKKEAYESLIHTEENPTGKWHVTYMNPETGEDDRQNKGGAAQGQ